jgi:ribosomal protein S18 acetylase RimI-like enzyme
LRVAALDDLRREMLAPLLQASVAENFRMLVRLEQDWLGGTNRFDRPGEILLSASEGSRLLGVCGLNVDPYENDPTVGRVRHLYVLPADRRRGVGGLLVRRITAESRGAFRRLTVRTDNEIAARFYLAMGFTAIDNNTATHELALESW